MVQEKALQFMGSFINLSEYSPGLRLDRLQLIKKITNLSIIDSLFLLSRIDILLNHNSHLINVFDQSIQEKLIDLIFNAEQSVMLKRFLSSKDKSVVFHSQQIYLCMGFVLRFGRRERGPLTSMFYQELGRSLLFLNEFCNDGTPPITGPREAQRAKMAGILWQIGQFSLSMDTDLGSEMTRLYLVINNSHEGVALSSKFCEATGVDLKTFWAIVFAIYAKWGTSASEFIPEGVVLEGSNHFINCKSLKQEDIDRTLDILSADIESLRKTYDNRLKSFKNETFNFEFLREKPLLEFEPNRFICLSFPYLVMRTTRGILEIVRTQIGSERFNEELGQALGDAFEAYVRSLLEKAYSTPFATRVIQRKHKAIQISDGVIDYGDAAIFIEVKAKSIQKQYRLSNDFYDIEKGLRSFLVKKGAKQLWKRINEFNGYFGARVHVDRLTLCTPSAEIGHRFRCNWSRVDNEL